MHGVHAGSTPTALGSNFTAPGVEGDLQPAAAPGSPLSVPAATASPPADFSPGTFTKPSPTEAPSPERPLPPASLRAPRWFEDPTKMIAIAVAVVCALLLAATIVGLFVRHRRRQRRATRAPGPTHTHHMHADPLHAAGSTWLSPESVGHPGYAPVAMHNAHVSGSHQRPAPIAEEPANHCGPAGSQLAEGSQLSTVSDMEWLPAAPQPVQATGVATAASAKPSQLYSACSGGGGAGTSQQRLVPSGAVGVSDDRTERWVQGETSTQSLGAGRDGAHSQEMQTLSEKLSEKSGSRGRLRKLGSKLLKSSSTDMQRCDTMQVFAALALNIIRATVIPQTLCSQYVPSQDQY